MSLSHRTRHLAIFTLDRVISKMEVPLENLQLLATICLSLSIKVNFIFEAWFFFFFFNFNVSKVYNFHTIKKKKEYIFHSLNKI